MTVRIEAWMGAGRIDLVRALVRSHPAFAPEAVLESDRIRTPNVAAESALDEVAAGLSAWLNPPGGRSISLPDVMAVLREVSRHDLGFGLSYCTTSFMAAANLWLAGSARQRRMFGEVLRRGERVAVAYHELEHGNNIAANAFKATRTAQGWRLDGIKSVINNIDRAGCLVLHADTAEITSGTPQQRRHSLFFLDRSHLEGSGVTLAPRWHTAGARNCRIAGIRFDDHLVPADCLMGEQGKGFDYALRSFQLSRTVLPGASLGCVESAFVLAMRFALERRLYDGDLLALPLVRRKLAHAAARLWAADCLAQTLAAAVHAVPGHMGVYSAVAKFWIPTAMRAVLRDLSTLLGARGYLREGPYAQFEKIVRDYPVVSLGHASALMCQALVVPMLPRVLCRTARSVSLDTMFDPLRRIPLDVECLRLGAPSGDPLLERLESHGGVSERLDDQLRSHALRIAAARIALANRLRPTSAPEAGGDAARYATLLASACILHRHAADPALASPAAPPHLRMLSDLALDLLADVSSPASVDRLVNDLAMRVRDGCPILPSHDET